MTNNINNTLGVNSLDLLRCGCGAYCENQKCDCPTGQPLTNNKHVDVNTTLAKETIETSSIKSK